MDLKRLFIFVLCAVMLDAAALAPCAAGISKSAVSPSFDQQALGLRAASYANPLSQHPTTLVRRQSEIQLNEETRILLSSRGIDTLEDLAARGLSELNRFLSVDALTAIAELLSRSGFADWSVGEFPALKKLIHEIYGPLGMTTNREIVLPPRKAIVLPAVKIKQPKSLVVTSQLAWPEAKILLPWDSEKIKSLSEIFPDRLFVHLIQKLRERNPSVRTLSDLAEMTLSDLHLMMGDVLLVKLLLALILRGHPPSFSTEWKGALNVFVNLCRQVTEMLNEFEAAPPSRRPERSREDASA
jgi:hypothetical protein